MSDELNLFEAIVRRADGLTDHVPDPNGDRHPFDDRDVYEGFPPVVRKLFDNGHYAQATFEGFKFLESEVKRLSGSSESGVKLMMGAFDVAKPKIRLTAARTPSQKDEQEGYKFLFAGAIQGIRNPRGHEHSVRDDPNACLDHLALASILLRRLSEAEGDVPALGLLNDGDEVVLHDR